MGHTHFIGIRGTESGKTGKVDLVCANGEKRPVEEIIQEMARLVLPLLEPGFRIFVTAGCRQCEQEKEISAHTTEEESWNEFLRTCAKNYPELSPLEAASRGVAIFALDQFEQQLGEVADLLSILLLAELLGPEVSVGLFAS